MPPPDESFDTLEEHEFGPHTIRIEFYKSQEDLYSAWPYVRLRQDGRETMNHFQVRGQFTEKAQAREAALARGRELIANGFDLNNVG